MCRSCVEYDLELSLQRRHDLAAGLDRIMADLAYALERAISDERLALIYSRLHEGKLPHDDAYLLVSELRELRRVSRGVIRVAADALSEGEG